MRTATSANKLLMEKAYSFELSPDLVSLLVENASDAQICGKMREIYGDTFADLVDFAAQAAAHNAHRSSCLTVFGRVDAGAVADRINKRGYVTARDGLCFRSGHIGLAWVDGAVAVRPDLVLADMSGWRPCACSAYETAAVMAGKHRLYATQRAMLAGGPPVDPGLVLAASYWRPNTDDCAGYLDGLNVEYLAELASYQAELASCQAEKNSEALRNLLPPVIL